MSRPLRIEYPGAWYHIMHRGRRYEAIFEDTNDYAELHWYEAHGIGRKKMKIKQLLD